MRLNQDIMSAKIQGSFGDGTAAAAGPPEAILIPTQNGQSSSSLGASAGFEEKTGDYAIGPNTILV